MVLLAPDSLIIITSLYNQFMKRPKIKIFHDNLYKSPPPSQVSPWNSGTPLVQKSGLQQIPTYRRQIVQKFLDSIHKKNKKSLNTQYSPDNSSSFDQHNEKCKEKQKQKERINRCLKDNMRSAVKTQSNDTGEELEVMRIFRDQCQRKRKSQLKTAMIYFDTSVEKEQIQKKQKFQRQQQQNKKVFTRKLRLKQELANKKNIERASRKRRSATVSNIFRNPFYLYEFGNIESSKKHSQVNKINPSLEYQRASSLRKRPCSEIGLRSKSVNVIF